MISKYYEGIRIVVMRYDEYCALMEQETNACVVSVVKLVGKRALEGPRRRCEGIIKLQLTGRNREGVGRFFRLKTETVC